MAESPLTLRVFAGVMLARRVGMFHGVQSVAMRYMRVVAGCLAIATLVMFGRLAVVLCRVIVMFGCLGVMVGTFMFGHKNILEILS